MKLPLVFSESAVVHERLGSVITDKAFDKALIQWRKANVLIFGSIKTVY